MNDRFNELVVNTGAYAANSRTNFASVFSLNRETKRDIDAYSCRVEDVETGEELSVMFRHRDLILTNE